ncbi:MAG: hypothetical protein K9N06_12605 [Candidatus Cloacimonetes bacterium]|nr:hypothetical protein [Candidatus Cloacimonadota bacterium]
MASLGEVARFFTKIDQSRKSEVYYYHVFMILIQSKMTLQKLLTIRLSDLDNDIFRMHYNKVEDIHFNYLKRCSMINENSRGEGLTKTG